MTRTNRRDREQVLLALSALLEHPTLYTQRTYAFLVLWREVIEEKAKRGEGS